MFKIVVAFPRAFMTPGAVPDGAGSVASIRKPASAQWPIRLNTGVCRLSAVLIALLYCPILAQTASRWFTSEQYSHGFLILPIAGLLLWRRRARFVGPAKPSIVGLVPLGAGLMTYMLSRTLQFEYGAMVSLVPTIAGVILLTYGRPYWRAARFPVLFLCLTANLPGFVLQGPGHWMQQASATGAAVCARWAGFAVIQHGNILQLPGMELEVAGVCSGFRKLTALFVAAILYGHLYPTGPVRRIGLIFLMAPIALAVNTVRLCVLVAAASWWGPVAERRLHDPAECAVIVLSLVCMTLIARLLGCGRPMVPLERAPRDEDGQIPPALVHADASRWRLTVACPFLLAGTLVLGSVVAIGADGAHVRLTPAGLPVRLGSWHSAPGRPLSPIARRLLPSADAIDRVYTNAAGDSVDLVVVSTVLAEDAHDPEYCFTAQGWKVARVDEWPLGKERVRHDHVIGLDGALDLVYWFETTLYREDTWRSATARIRDALNDRGSILVRLTTAKSARSEAVLREFAQELAPTLQEWKSSGRGEVGGRKDWRLP